MKVITVILIMGVKMDIIKNLMDAIPLLEGDNKKVIQDLLTQKLKESAEEKEEVVEDKATKDYQELMAYNGGE